MKGLDKFNQLKSPLANHIENNGDTFIYFGGTAYLGIPQNELFLELYLQGLKKFGLNNGTSRNNNVQLGIYNEAENFAAKKFGSESALITSSGYLAAQMVVNYVAKLGEVRYAPATHPALWQSGDPNVRGSFNEWVNCIVEEINSSAQNNWVIISNSMNNLYPEIYDFSFIKTLNKEVILVVDDSHGIGINNNGLGAYSALKDLHNLEVLVIASMAKALGVDAGLVLGSAKLISQLKYSNIFLGASPPAAAGLFAFMHSDEIYKHQLIALREKMSLLSDLLISKEDWHFLPDFPVYYYKKADLSAKLLKHHILVSSFPYPDKDGPIVNRVVLSSWHTKAEIKKLKEAIK